MFNSNCGGYSLSDIAAATGRNSNDCCGGNGYGNGFMGDGAW